MRLNRKSSCIGVRFATVFFPGLRHAGVTVRHAAARSCLLALLLGPGACTAPGTGISTGADIPEFAGAGVDAGASREALPEAGAFLAVDAGMREFVARHLLSARPGEERLRRLSLLLQNPGYLGIRYDAELTLGAGELFRRREGNCLSFSALFVALAREAGLHAYFQDVVAPPSGRMDGETFVVEQHVNAVVRIGGRRFVVDLRPPQVLSGAAVNRIPDARATALWFANLGVERLTGGALEPAYRLFRRGLEVDPQAAPLWVNLGVALARNGQLDAASFAYGRALRFDPDNLSALSNLAAVAERRGEHARADALRERVRSRRARNPYYHYWIAERHLHEGDAQSALAALQQALRRLPGESDFHFALARVLRALGREEEAARSLATAIERAAGDTVRARYRAQFGDSRGGT